MSNGITYTWDDAKRLTNIRDHNVDFTAVPGFEWETALIWIDARKEYGEERRVALGKVGG